MRKLLSLPFGIYIIDQLTENHIIISNTFTIKFPPTIPFLNLLEFPYLAPPTIRISRYEIH